MMSAWIPLRNLQFLLITNCYLMKKVRRSLTKIYLFVLRALGHQSVAFNGYIYNDLKIVKVSNEARYDVYTCAL